MLHRKIIFDKSKKSMYNKLTEFKEDMDNYKNKKYINIANKILQALGNTEYKLDVHHPPFL